MFLMALNAPDQDTGKTSAFIEVLILAAVQLLFDTLPLYFGYILAK